MRKVSLWAFLIIFLFYPCLDSPGNCEEKDKFSLSVETTFIDAWKIIEYDDLGDPDILSTSQTFLNFSYGGLFEDLTLNLKLGVAKFEISPSVGSSTLLFDYGPGLGLGMSSRIYDKNKSNIDLGFEYLYFIPEELKRGNLIFEARPREWHLWVLGERNFEKLSLWGGIRYSEITIPYEHPSGLGTRKGGFEEVENVGVFFGSRLRVSPELFFFLEGDFLAREGFVLGTGCNF